jgi:hypothetical protein
MAAQRQSERELPTGASGCSGRRRTLGRQGVLALARASARTWLPSPSPSLSPSLSPSPSLALGCHLGAIALALALAFWSPSPSLALGHHRPSLRAHLVATAFASARTCSPSPSPSLALGCHRPCLCSRLGAIAPPSPRLRLCRVANSGCCGEGSSQRRRCLASTGGAEVSAAAGDEFSSQRSRRLAT